MASRGAGAEPDLLAVADTARERGARVVAVTASHSPLARKADVTLLVDHAEDANLQMPMVSRVLHLLMVDILAVGLALQRGGSLPQPVGGEHDDVAQAAPARAHSVAPGVSAAVPQCRFPS